jgi:hypothetical protein
MPAEALGDGQKIGAAVADRFSVEGRSMLIRLNAIDPSLSDSVTT